jgi:hypothetical protein
MVDLCVCVCASAAELLAWIFFSRGTRWMGATSMEFYSFWWW